MAKSNDVNSFDLRRHETGFFLPEIDFDFLDAMLTETSNDGVDLNDASNDQDHRTTELSMNLRPIDEQVLSQKMSQLSTIKMIDNHEWSARYIRENIEDIVNRFNRRDGPFRQLIDQVVLISNNPSMSSKKKKEDLHKFVKLQLKLKLISMYQRLWTSYLDSGTGKLSFVDKIHSTNLCVWPKEVKQIILPLAKGFNDVDRMSIDLITQHLDELDRRYKRCQLDLTAMIDQINLLSPMIHEVIEKYIEERLVSTHQDINHRIELLPYDYHIRALKIIFLQHQPNSSQIKSMKILCRYRYEQETTEQEHKLMEQQLDNFMASDLSYPSLSISCRALVESIEDSTVQHEIFQRYHDLAEQFKLNMSNLYRQTAEEEKNRCKKNYEMVYDRLVISNDEQMPLVLIDLIEQRCNRIGDRVRCVYQYKARCIDRSSCP